jgi:hypothetical protein
MRLDRVACLLCLLLALPSWAQQALQVPFGSRVYARAQAGYSLYFQQASRFVLGADTYTFPDFAVSLSGPQAGLLLGVHI